MKRKRISQKKNHVVKNILANNKEFILWKCLYLDQDTYKYWVGGRERKMRKGDRER